MSRSPLQQLQHILQSSEPIRLTEAALCVARVEYPELNIDSYLHQLDELSENVRSRLSGSENTFRVLDAINHVVFEVEQFGGNQKDYYDPRNSFLNEVIERRKGIPITLALIYIDIAQKLDVPLVGVSFPGHFLVKLDIALDTPVVLDPFNKGRTLGRETLMRLIQDAYRNRQPQETRLFHIFRAAQPEEILLRLLRNLKTIYVKQEAWWKVLNTLNTMLIIMPQLVDEWRDRAMVHQKMENSQAALSDYEYYLALHPEASDATVVQSHIKKLKKFEFYLH